jgi:hypothetical protein
VTRRLASAHVHVAGAPCFARPEHPVSQIAEEPELRGLPGTPAIRGFRIRLLPGGISYGERRVLS